MNKTNKTNKTNEPVQNEPNEGECVNEWTAACLPAIGPPKYGPVPGGYLSNVRSASGTW